MYYIEIWHLHTLWNDHHGKASNCLSSHKIVTILLTILLMLYITSLWLIYFITGSLYLFHIFCPPHFSPLWQPPFCSLYLWVCFNFVLFCFLDSTYTRDPMEFSFSVWLISLNIIPSKSIHVAANDKISFFYDRAIFHCVCVYIHIYVCVNICIYTHTHTHTHTNPTSSLSIYLSEDTYVAFMSWLL